MIRRPPRSTPFPTRRSSDLKILSFIAVFVSTSFTSLTFAQMPCESDVERIQIEEVREDRKSTRLNSSHGYISYAVFCLKKKKIYITLHTVYRHRHTQRY